MVDYSKLFSEGEPVLFLDQKDREYYDILKSGKQKNIRGDILIHDEIIGKQEGFRLISKRNNFFRVFRPTLAEYTRLMRRGAQVIYAKDISHILVWADIYPGAKVVECGLGSGALTSFLLRAVGGRGKVISYEIRPDFINNATKNIDTFVGLKKNHTVREIDIYEQFVDKNVDRLILDVPEPWRAVASAADALRPGAVLCSYSPTILQVRDFVQKLHELKTFTRIQTHEIMLREWKVDDVSVRPMLRMVAHTAFLTTARKYQVD
ncbi:MAG: tRNA (adenine-N1)-methyltransferase [Deferribacteres bacterium]|nr:tRNA (adenine-N1)-methyltransferase [candidate division KSB1 bacterium]MCB9512371.1 tRNA (adenine-N1)-methyltransferase [Deferribacteres bacterium]